MSENLPARVAERPVAVDPSQKITDLDAAWRLCDKLAQSSIVPTSLRGKPANVFIVIMAGQELGQSWSVALRTIYSPGDGQIGIRGQLVLAKLREARHRYSWEEGGDWCEFTLVRSDEEPPGNVYKSKFTIEDARTANLLHKDNWKRYPARMLFWRAVADCVGRAAPETTLGFAIAETIEAEPVDLRPAEQTPAPPNGEAAPAEAARELAELNEQMTAEAGKLTPAEVEQARHYMETSPEFQASRDAAEHARAEGRTISVEQVLAELNAENGEPGNGGELANGEESASGGESIGVTLAREADEAEAAAQADEPSRAAIMGLGKQFARIGWPVREYTHDVYRVCSLFARRHITKVSELSNPEVIALTNELLRIMRVHGEEPLVALANQAGKWEEDWREADPDGLAAYLGEA